VAWFSRSSSPAARAASPGHRSQALKALLDSLRPEGRRTVLDLGPPLAGNIEFLSGLSCRVRIADLHRSLCAETVENRQAEAMGATLERLLPLAPEERFDALLAWDVFDYMRPDQVATLMARLAPACRDGALVLVLASTRRQIPAAPLRHRILDRESMASEGPLVPLRPGPCHGQPDLKRMMPGFSVRHSVLLRSGVQEFLFARGAAREPVGIPGGRAARGGPSRTPWFRRGPR
jgi:hypothetical protein